MTWHVRTGVVGCFVSSFISTFAIHPKGSKSENEIPEIRSDHSLWFNSCRKSFELSKHDRFCGTSTQSEGTDF